jgi:outer membrane lipoprotein-sorting protein
VISGKRLFSILAALLVISGCAAFRPPAQEPPGPPKLAAASIRARAVVEMKQSASAAAGRAVILAKAPGSFRIEVIGPFGQSAALIASDGEKLFISSEGKTSEFLWGDPGIPYSFKAGEVVSFLTGSPDATGGTPGAAIIRDEWGRLSEYTRAVEGKAGLKVTAGDYREVSGAHIPFLIRIEDGQRELVIKYTEVEINPPLEEEFFRLKASSSDQGSKEVD